MLDEDTGMFYIGNKIISLTFYESMILEVLIKNKYKTVSYEEFLKELYNEKDLTSKGKQKVNALLWRLKQKLKLFIDIRHIRNKGYILIGEVKK